MNSSASPRTINDSLREYGRGVAGGLLFSLPLLYTMEVWWQGFIAHPLPLLIYTLGTFVLLLGYNRYAGLHEDATFAEVAIDSIEELGIGIVLSALILWLLGRIGAGVPLPEVMGKIIIEAMPIAIGVSVGTAQLGTDDQQEQEDSQEQKSDSGQAAKNDGEEQQEERPDYLEQVVIALCGAILIAANVGPTEEIVILGIEATPPQLIFLMLFSLLLCALILYFSDFRGADRHVGKSGPLDMVRGIITTYAVAIAASAVICWFFGRFAGASILAGVGQTIVLAFPATLGASAGRLLLQTNSQG